MPTVSVTNHSNQSRILIHTTVLANSTQKVDLFEWLKAKEMLKPYNLVPSEISADEYEVSTVLENIRKSTFDEFEMAGETSIKSAIDEGGVFDKHRRILAREWLESKNEIRENRRDRREEEAVLIAKEAKLATIEQARWAKWAMVISFLALVASVISVIVPLLNKK